MSSPSWAPVSSADVNDPPDPGAGKEEWRRWARARRSELDLDRISSGVVDALGSWDPLQQAATVLLFLPMADEIDLHELLARGLSTTFAATRTPGRGPLTVHPLGGKLEQHPYGFLQPEAAAPPIDPRDLSVLLVPGLAYDRDGVRLGRGAGYFDELLGRADPSAPRVGVTPEALLVDGLPNEPHDVRMTHLATEAGVWEVGSDTVTRRGTKDLPTASLRFVDRASAAGFDVDPFVFPEGTRTAADAAAAIGCDVAAIVKSLVFMADDRPVLVLMPGDLRVNTVKLAMLVGADKARRATLEEVRTHTGYAAGGTPPFGHDTGLEVIADEALRRYREVWAAAGTPTTVFPAEPNDLVAAAGGRWAEVAERG